jgi:hypothetical protein
MHRATPMNTSFRSYTAGGARSAVDQADDSKLMQEMGGNFMAGETRSAIEAPQNYGFTSVVMGATKDATGAITDSAEAVISFMGGNRSFPVAGVMDDRRHRLYGMQPGDSAMFSTVGRKQQFHMNTDGGFWLAPLDKTVRLGLLDQQSQSDQQQQPGAGPATRDGSSAGTGTTGGSSSGQQQKGQKPLYQDQQKTYRFVDVTQNMTRVSGNEAHLMLSDGDSYVHCINQQTYLGGASGKHTFAPVQTTSGPSVNVFARVGSLAQGEEEAAVIIGEPEATRASSALLPVVLALLLGVSLGINYSAWPVVAANACQLASR